MNPKQFFEWIESDEGKRKVLLKTIGMMFKPRVGRHAIVIIGGGSWFIRDVLIKLVLCLDKGSIVIDHTFFHRLPFKTHSLMQENLHASIIHVTAPNLKGLVRHGGLYVLDTYPTKDEVFDPQTKKTTIPTCWFLLEEEALIEKDEALKIPDLYKGRTVHIKLAEQQIPDKNLCKDIENMMDVIMSTADIKKEFKEYIMNHI